LVRPDNFIAWRARNVAADASSTLVEVFGRLLGRTPLSTREGVAAAAE